MSDTSHGSIDLEPEPPRERVRVREQLRHKLPEILLEAGSVVFAILLAFAVDQWREDREHREMAQRARETIVAELRANRTELSGTLKGNDEKMASLQDLIARLQRKDEVHEIDTSMHLAQLSSAAFQAAQSTQAIQFVDFEWLVKTGRVYELQKTYVTAQDAALNEVSVSIGLLHSGEKPLPILQRMRGRLATAQQLAHGLLAAYAETTGK